MYELITIQLITFSLGPNLLCIVLALRGLGDYVSLSTSAVSHQVIFNEQHGALFHVEIRAPQM